MALDCGSGVRLVFKLHETMFLLIHKYRYILRSFPVDQFKVGPRHSFRERLLMTGYGLHPDLQRQTFRRAER
jgi:hypothetical protein